jgi:hypothetical protein
MTSHRRHRSTRSPRITKYLSAPHTSALRGFTPPGQQVLGVVMPWNEQPKGGSQIDRMGGWAS